MASLKGTQKSLENAFDDVVKRKPKHGFLFRNGNKYIFNEQGKTDGVLIDHEFYYTVVRALDENGGDRDYAIGMIMEEIALKESEED